MKKYIHVFQTQGGPRDRFRQRQKRDAIIVGTGTIDPSRPVVIALPASQPNPEYNEMAHDELVNANEIALVIFDQDNLPAVEVTFRGARDPHQWFSAENLISSSIWEISRDDLQGNEFYFGYYGTTNYLFQLSTVKSGCETPDFQNYFSVFSSYSDGDCTFNEHDEQIFYSDSKNPKSVSDLKEASEIRILTKKYFNGPWILQFRFSSYSTLNFLDYYEGNAQKEFSSKLEFRSANFKQDIRFTAKFIVVVFENETLVGSIIIDPGRKIKDEKTWFSTNSQITSDEFVFDDFAKFDLTGPINNNFLSVHKNDAGTSCQNQFGWLSILCNFGQESSGNCDFENWWKSRNVSDNEQCVIYYSLQGTLWNSNNFKIASKIEIYTIYMDPILRYFAETNLNFETYYTDNVRTVVPGYPESSLTVPEYSIRANDAFTHFYWMDYLNLVIYDQNYRIAQELIFKGSKQSDWFLSSNLLETSSWDLSSVRSMSFFHKNKDSNYAFVMQDNFRFCQTSSGYLVITCSNTCSWEIIAPENKDCLILYTPNNFEKSLMSEMIRAPKIEIYASPLTFYSEYADMQTWQKIFSVESFSGVNIYNYFKDGSVEPALSDLSIVHFDKIYRHPRMQDKIISAAYIRFTVYDFDGEIIMKQIEFKATGDLESWFHWGTVLWTYGWNLESSYTDSNNGHNFNIKDDSTFHNQERYFQISEFWITCPGDSAWFTAFTRYDGAGLYLYLLLLALFL